jgi:hypothetical protein
VEWGHMKPAALACSAMWRHLDLTFRGPAPVDPYETALRTEAQSPTPTSKRGARARMILIAFLPSTARLWSWVRHENRARRSSAIV